MARSTVLFTDQLQRGPGNIMTAVARNAGRTASAEGPAVCAVHVVFGDAHVTAAAERRDFSGRRNTPVSTCRVHGIYRIHRVTAMTGVAGDAMFGMDTGLPERHRLA